MAIQFKELRKYFGKKYQGIHMFLKMVIITII